ncbi:spinster family MFS transporter [Sphingobium subterraneum]|uniref:Putative MFS family arabinose efflux permease n=1 Tax=Sphingobium subterraneum TaxID=627688 RepID=A0A841J558_9SPHN|nr:MFS transporter [Sphingobium subterraneum]MBB6123695.1 putative MFS family arabinose efflux permease [Sphingobium subterraneum]
MSQGKGVGHRKLGGGIALVLTLTLLNTINYTDRALISILAQPIKADLHLSDLQIGLLSGFAFALVYSVLALPLSRIIDRGYHKVAIIGSTITWSIMTALGGFANSFWSLAAMRIGVALGEASLHPASHSLISLRLPVSARGKALALFSMGLPLGVGLGSFFGGWLSDDHGWRTAFLVLGPVGLLTVPLLLFVLPSTREQVQAQASAPVSNGKFSDLTSALALLWKRPVFRFLFVGQAIISMFGFSLTAFVGAFFMRVHGWSALQTGSFIAFSNGLGGSIGLLLGGVVFDFVGKRWPRIQMLPIAAALLLSGSLAILAWLVPSSPASAVCAFLATFLYLSAAVPPIAMAQSVAEPHMRATASALMTLSASLIGATAGPLLVGATSDFLTPIYGARGIAWALVGISCSQLAGAYCFWRAGRSRAQDGHTPPSA